jgi:F0F1-type ATP synthase assembly protein I
MKRKYKPATWFLSFVLVVAVGAFITQFKPTVSHSKNFLIILFSLLGTGLVLWIFFRTGLAEWVEKWMRSSYDDFLREVEKSKKKK